MVKRITPKTNTKNRRYILSLAVPEGTVTEIEQKYKMFVIFIIHFLYPLTNVLLPVPDKSAASKLTPKILQTLLKQKFRAF